MCSNLIEAALFVAAELAVYGNDSTRFLLCSVKGLAHHTTVRVSALTHVYTHVYQHFICNTWTKSHVPGPNLKEKGDLVTLRATSCFRGIQ